jgi:integrase
MATSQLDLGDRWRGTLAAKSKPEPLSMEEFINSLDASQVFLPEVPPANPDEGIVFEDACYRWLAELQNRASKKVSPATLVTFRSRVATILKLVGPMTRLADFRNIAMAKFVQDAPKDWSAATLHNHMNCIRLILGSFTNDAGDPLFPVRWNAKKINCPDVVPPDHRPVSPADVEALIAAAGSLQEKALYVFLAASGLRIGEAQSVRINSADSAHSSWSVADAKVSLRTNVYKNFETGRLKTRAAKRDVLLCKTANDVLIEFVETYQHKDGEFLFQSKHGRCLRQSTLRHWLRHRVPGSPITSPHAFRRFRISTMEGKVSPSILKSQVGHSKEFDITAGRYTFQDEQRARMEIESCGLGFNLRKESGGD